MPMELNVGVCRKIGQPDYGSLGATCSVKVELSGSLIFDDPDAFQRHVRQAYAACERAVDDQLGGQQQPSPAGNASTRSEAPVRRTGTDAGHQSGNGNGRRPVTEKQLTYIRQLSGQIKGLGVRRLDTLADNMYGKPLAGLTSFEASGVIDCLKGIKAGEIDLHAALDGASK